MRRLPSVVPDASSPVRRHSPVERVCLTNADLDHVLGLFHLREGGRFPVTAPDGVWASLGAGLRLPEALSAYGEVDYRPAPLEWAPLAAGLEFRAVPLDGEPPPYARNCPAGGLHGVGYLFREGEGKPVAGIFPDVAALGDSLRAALAECALVLFDGTVWDDDELRREGVGTKTARQMGHLPVSQSLAPLAALKLPACGYLHLNNTNPILRPDSAERRAVEAAGLFVAEDGQEFIL